MKQKVFFSSVHILLFITFLTSCGVYAGDLFAEGGLFGIVPCSRGSKPRHVASRIEAKTVDVSSFIGNDFEQDWSEDAITHVPDDSDDVMFAQATDTPLPALQLLNDHYECGDWLAIIAELATLEASSCDRSLKHRWIQEHLGLDHPIINLEYACAQIRDLTQIPENVPLATQAAYYYYRGLLQLSEDLCAVYTVPTEHNKSCYYRVMREIGEPYKNAFALWKIGKQSRTAIIENQTISKRMSDQSWLSLFFRHPIYKPDVPTTLWSNIVANGTSKPQYGHWALKALQQAWCNGTALTDVLKAISIDQ